MLRVKYIREDQEAIAVEHFMSRFGEGKNASRGLCQMVWRSGLVWGLVVFGAWAVALWVGM